MEYEDMAWKHIKRKQFNKGYQVLLFDNKFKMHPCKLQLHWLKNFIVVEIKDSVVNLMQVEGILHIGWVNNTCLKAIPVTRSDLVRSKVLF